MNSFLVFLNNCKRSLLSLPSVWFIIFFVLLNALFKFYFLPVESIYGDEAYSIFHAQKNFNELKEIFLHDQNPPMHIALLHFWLKIFGISDISAKSFSVVLSVLCAIILFIFSKKFFDKYLAIAVSVLFLFSNAQFFYSHEVRTYALVQFLCIASFYYYFKLLKDPDKLSVLLLAFINLLLLFSHYLTIHILVIQFICVWMYYKENKIGVRYYIISQFIVGIIFIPWLKVLIANLPQSGSFWLTTPGFGELQWFVFMINGDHFLFYIFTSIILSSIIMLFLNKRYHFFISEFDLRVYLVFFTWYALPILTDFVIAQYTPVFLGRYFLYSSLGLFLLLAYIIRNLNSNQNVPIALFMIISASIISAFNIYPQKEDDWKSIVPVIKKTQTPGTIIFISASYKYKDFAFYYDINAFKDYNNTISRLANEHVYCSQEGKLNWNNINIDSVDQIIYIQSHDQFEDPNGKIKQSILDKKFKICKEYSLINLAYTVFRKDNLPCYEIKKLTNVNSTYCDFWSYNIGFDEETGDTAYIYSANMEPDLSCSLPHSINNNKALSGHYSCKINKDDQYSIRITKLLSELKGKNKINVSAFLNSEENSNPHLVVSVEKGHQSFFRKELTINEALKNINKWSELNLFTIIPKGLPSCSTLKIYFWNPEKPAAYIDDCRVEIY